MRNVYLNKPFFLVEFFLEIVGTVSVSFLPLIIIKGTVPQSIKNKIQKTMKFILSIRNIFYIKLI